MSRVGEERFIGDVYLKRVRRKPPTWECTNDNLVTVLMMKGRRGTRRTWHILLPEGGIHSFPTRREACSFVSRLAPLSQTDLEAPVL